MRRCLGERVERPAEIEEGVVSLVGETQNEVPC